MASSDVVNSGRFAAGRSSFSQTCSRLSQYLKENGGFGDLNLGFPRTENKVAPVETMDLLPMIEKSGESSSSGDLNAANDGGAAPLTIFYGGQVIVFDDFPAEKAKEIMALASKSSATHNQPNAAVAPLLTAHTPPEKVFPTFRVQERPHHAATPLDSDLPIARKNSLARFLEKRKDRVVANAPYPVNKPAAAAAPNAVKAEAWLELGPQLPLQIQRH